MPHCLRIRFSGPASATAAAAGLAALLRFRGLPEVDAATAEDEGEEEEEEEEEGDDDPWATAGT